MLILLEQKCFNGFCTGNMKIGSLVNSEDQDEISSDMHFFRVYTFYYDQRNLLENNLLVLYSGLILAQNIMRDNMGLVVRKPVFGGLRTTEA